MIEWPKDKLIGSGPMIISPEDADRHARETGEYRARAQIRRERIAADAQATAYLAAQECPRDLIEWGRNNRIPEFAQFTWQAGFAAGWRFALAHVRKDAEQ